MTRSAEDSAPARGGPSSAADDTSATDRARWASLRALVLPASLTLAVTLLLGARLWIEGFEYAPHREVLTNALRVLPTLAIVVALRAAMLLARRRDGRVDRRALLRSALSAAACFALLSLLVSPVTWGKLLVPLLNPTLWDAELYRLDLALHLDTDPILFLHALLDYGALDWLIGRVYELFPLMLVGGTTWFMTHPDLEQRHRFVRGLILVWLVGLATYIAIPALGPCYVSESLLPVLRERFPRHHGLQVALMHNYQNVKALLDGGANARINLAYGIGAMPSLHVAFPAYVYFHCRSFRHPARWPSLAVLVLFVVGSMVTGWHYAVDAYAGIALAWLCWLSVRRRRALDAAVTESGGSDTVVAVTGA